MSNKLDRYDQAVRQIAASGTSTDRWVTVVRDEGGELSVRIERGGLRHLNEEQLAAEIRSALLAAVAAHQTAWIRIRREFFGNSLDWPDTVAGEPS